MIKLVLDDAEYTDEMGQAGRDKLRSHIADDIRATNKSVVDVLVDYLIPFFKHIMDHMSEKGSNDSQSSFHRARCTSCIILLLLTRYQPADNLNQ